MYILELLDIEEQSTEFWVLGQLPGRQLTRQTTAQVRQQLRLDNCPGRTTAQVDNCPRVLTAPVYQLPRFENSVSWSVSSELFLGV